MNPKPTNRVILIVEGGIADWVLKPDNVDVEIFDFDCLEWLSRDQRDRLMTELESGDDRLASIAVHMADEHLYDDEVDLSALPALHAEQHEVDCGHEHTEDPEGQGRLT